MWKEGRQESTIYHKLTFFSQKIFNIGVDAHILRYPKGSILGMHVDEVKGKHWRLNINLKGESIFACDECIYRSSWMNLFRSDLNMHGLRVITKTYKLSLGFAKLNNL